EALALLLDGFGADPAARVDEAELALAVDAEVALLVAELRGVDAERGGDAFDQLLPGARRGEPRGGREARRRGRAAARGTGRVDRVAGRRAHARERHAQLLRDDRGEYGLQPGADVLRGV